MCGIVGILDTRPDGEVDPSIIERMLESIVHRGPDDAGTYTTGQVGLGTRRLKIIDLEGGHQPLSNEDGSAWVAFNGEIYNHEARRTALARSGHHFRTRCDTEVIIHEWEAHGEQCVDWLDGQFGFAIWDAPSHTLMLARDRLGIKPLYYSWDGTRLVFSSEIKGVLASDLVPRAVDLQSLYHYIGYEFVPAPATMFRGIHKLPAGHRLIVHDGELDIQPYWDVRFGPEELSEDECISGIRQLLGEAVEQRLMSDVPLGVFLSGGLDSTAVLAFAREATSQPLPTFTIGYADSTFSEWGLCTPRSKTLRDGPPRDRDRTDHAGGDRTRRLASRRADDRSVVTPVSRARAQCTKTRDGLPIGRGRRRGLRWVRPLHRIEARAERLRACARFLAAASRRAGRWMAP